MANDDDVKRFAALLRKKDADEQAVRDAEKARAEDERVKAEAARVLGLAKQDKEAAAARMRELRRRTYTPAQLAAAEADYRAALARELELQSGERPTWAPAPVALLEVEPDPVVGESGGGVDEAISAD